MEAISEYFLLALLVLMFSVPVVLNLFSRIRSKDNESHEDAGNYD